MITAIIFDAFGTLFQVSEGGSVCDDIIGPKALGIKTVLVDRKKTMGDKGQDYTVSDLRQLYEITKSSR